MGRPKGSKNGNHTEKVPVQYDYAESVEEIAKELIPKYFSFLATASIAYLFVNKEITQKGKKTVATGEKISKKVKALCNKDFLITVSYPIWNELDQNTKKACIHHELNHFMVEESDSGEEKFSILSHDYEDFFSTIRLFGKYRGEIEVLADVVNDIEKDKEEKTDDLFDE